MLHVMFYLMGATLVVGLFAIVMLVRHPRFRNLSWAPVILTNLLLYILMVFASLVERHLDILQRLVLTRDLWWGGKALHVFHFFPRFGWLYSLVILAAYLLRQSWSARLRKILLVACLILACIPLSFYAVSRWTGWVEDYTMISDGVQHVFSLAVLTVCAWLILRAHRWEPSSRRKAVTLFGASIFGIQCILIVTFFILRATKPPELYVAATWVNGITRIGFFLFIPFWVYRYEKVFQIKLDDRLDLGRVLEVFASRNKLSKRELEVVRLICEGKANKEIADALFISLATVKDHAYNIFQKTGVKNRTELTRLVLHHPVQPNQ